MRQQVEVQRYQEHVQKFGCVPVVTMGSKTMHMEYDVATMGMVWEWDVVNDGAMGG